MPDKIILFQSLLKGNMAAQFSIVHHNTEFCLGSLAALLVHQLFMLPCMIICNKSQISICHVFQNEMKLNATIIVMQHITLIISPFFSAGYYSGGINAVQ